MPRVTHFEILGEDPEALARFYQQALGWKVKDAGMPGMKYMLVNTGPDKERGINGGMMARGSFPQGIINTLEVPSLAKTSDKIAAAGGNKVQGPYEIPGIGMHAYFVDPAGNMFGVLEPPKAARGAASRASAGRRAAAARKA